MPGCGLVATVGIEEQKNGLTYSHSQESVRSSLNPTTRGPSVAARRLAVLRLDAILQGGKESSLFMRAINGELATLSVRFGDNLLKEMNAFRVVV